MRQYTAGALLFLAIIVTAGCFYGPGSQGTYGGGQVINSSVHIHKAFSHFGWHGDGRYGTDIAMTGHFTFDSGYPNQLFPLSIVTIRLGEFCLPGNSTFAMEDGFPQTHNFAHYGSPYSLELEAGYANDPWDCLLGHALSWQWNWEWHASTPLTVADGGGDFDCEVLSGFENQQVC